MKKECGVFIFVFVIMIPLLQNIPVAYSTDCYNTMGIPYPFKDPDCYSEPCLEYNQLEPKMYDKGLCILSKIFDCYCENGKPIHKCNYYEMFEYYANNEFIRRETLSYNNCACGNCGVWDTDAGKCVSNNPSGGNDCFVCECDENNNPQCELKADPNPNLDTCRVCDSTFNIVYAPVRTICQLNSIWGACDEYGNCDMSEKGRITQRCPDHYIQTEGCSEEELGLTRCVENNVLEKCIKPSDASDWPNCFIWSVIGECDDEGNLITDKNKQKFVGKSCSTSSIKEGFWKRNPLIINDPWECVEKTCDNIYGKGWQGCGKSSGQLKNYQCCKNTRECNEGDKKGRAVCCDESTLPVKGLMSLMGAGKTDILWCNQKKCPFGKASGKVGSNTLEICCDEGEEGTSYHAKLTLGGNIDPALCGVECQPGETPCVREKGKNKRNMCCAEGKECVLLNEKYNVKWCVPKSCSKNEQMCYGKPDENGKPGNYENARICCPEGTACFWHPTGAPICYILEREKIPKNLLEFFEKRVTINLPHTSIYTLRDKDNPQISGTAFKVFSTNPNLKSLKLTLPYNGNYDNLEVYVYPNSFIEKNCVISELDSKWATIEKSKAEIKLGDVTLEIPEQSDSKASVSLTSLSIDCKNLDSTQFNHFFSIPFEEETQEEKPQTSCIIGRVIYTEEQDKEKLQTLRDYRDDVLNKSLTGRAVISFHYSSAGEITGKVIEKIPFAKKVIRKYLDYVVERYEKKEIES